MIRFDLSPCPHFNYPEDFDRGKFTPQVTPEVTAQVAGEVTELF